MATRHFTPPYALYRSAPAPRAFLAGLLSAVVPGAGQLYAGDRRRGVAMLAITLALALVALGFALRGRVFLLRELVQPEVLLGLLVVNALVFAFRAHAALDAYKAVRRSAAFGSIGGGRAALHGAAGILLLLGLVGAPHAVAGYYDYRSYDVLTTVFASEEPIDVPPAGSLSSLTGPRSSASAPDAVPDDRAAVPSPAQEPRSPVPPEDKPSYWEKRGRVNILLVGGDAGPYRYGIRTDTMIVVSIDTTTRRVAVFGIPRNLTAVPLPPSAHSDLETFPEILNALWGYAEAHSELFPGARRPGATALKETIGSLLAMRIDYFAAVDLRGFVEAVDALGGVTVNVQRHVWDAGVSPPIEGESPIAIDLEPGRHHLDGRSALAYVRTRWASSDYDRMHRQRCLIGSLTRQASVGRLLKSFPRIASTVKKYVLTDIPLKALPDLIELVADLDAKRMVGVSFAPPAFSTVPDMDAIRATVRRALHGRLDAGVGLETVRTNCA